MKYIYTAIITQCEDCFTATIPDLPGCTTTGTTLQDAIEQITDAASGWLVVAEDEDLPIHEASRQCDLPHDPTDICSLVQIDTFAYRALTDTKAVRKNVSLPAWLSNLADKKNINVSKVLQDALIIKLQA